jgi:hypothetical protein
MKHILNNLSQEEKQNILEQHSGGKRIDVSKFKSLLESKLGNVKPLTEGLLNEAAEDILREAQKNGIGITSLENINDWNVWVTFYNIPEYSTKSYQMYCDGKSVHNDIPSDIDPSILNTAKTYIVKFCNAKGKIKPASMGDAVGGGGSATKAVSSSDNYASTPSSGYLTAEYDATNSKPGDVYVNVTRDPGYPDTMYSQAGTVKQGVYSCKNKQWNNGEKIQIGKFVGGTNPFETDLKLTPSPASAKYPQVQKDNGKTPSEIAQAFANTFCSTAVFK